jgi:predicted site-specific integrase-resolvase
MSQNPEPAYTLTEKQLAQFLGISVDLVRHLRRSGRLPFVRINTRVVYLRDDARAFLEQNRHAAAEVGTC